MIKLYKKYVLLKINNSRKIYLFECGLFYLFIHEDAILMSNLLNLKLTPLNSTIMKCGFPVKSIDKYLTFLKNSDFDIEIVSSDTLLSPISLCDYSMIRDLKYIISKFLKIKLIALVLVMFL